MSRKRPSDHYFETVREDRPDYQYQRVPTSPYADSHASSQPLSRRSSIFSDLITVFRKNTSSHLGYPVQKKSSNALEQGLLLRQDSVAPTASKRFRDFFQNLKFINPHFSYALNNCCSFREEMVNPDDEDEELDSGKMSRHQLLSKIRQKKEVINKVINIFFYYSFKYFKGPLRNVKKTVSFVCINVFNLNGYPYFLRLLIKAFERCVLHRISTF
jgi:hypothetical protein